MLTSGGIQPILDEAAIHSEFRIQLLSYPRNTELSISDTYTLCTYIFKEVQNMPSRPEIGHLKELGYEGG